MAQGFTSGDPTRESGSSPGFSSSGGSSNTGSIIADAQSNFNTNLLKRLDSAIKFTDEQISKEAQEQARTAGEKIQQDTREAYFKNVIQAQAINSMPENTPAEVQAKTRELARLQDSYEAGAITASYYQSRMDATARGLRARFPGYRDEIDNTIAKIAGGRPANEIIGMILKEAAAKQPDPEKDYKHWEEQAIKAGVPEVAAAAARGEKMSLPQLKALVARDAAQEATLKRKQAELTFMSGSQGLATNISNEERANTRRLAEGIASQQAAIHMDKVLGAMSFDNPAIQQAMKDYEQGKAPDPKALTQIAGMTQKMQLQYEAAVDRIVDSAAYDGKSMSQIVGSVKDTDEIRKSLKDRGRMAIEALGKGDYSLLKSLKTMNDLIKDGAEANIRQGSQMFNTLGALQQFIPDADRSLLISESGKLRNQFEKDVVKAFGISVASGTNSGPMKTIGSWVEDASQGSTWAAKQEGIRRGIEAINSGTMPVDVKQNFYKTLFGDDKPGETLMDKLNPRERNEAFAMLTNPKAVEAIQKLEKDRPGTVDAFRKWMDRNATVHMMFEVGKINDVNAKKDAFYVTFNQEKGLMEAVKNPSYKFQAQDAAYRDQAQRQAQGLADNMNRSLAVMQSGLKLVAPPKQDYNLFVRNFLNRAGMQLYEQAAPPAQK